jgi:hypothetical protein
MALPTLATVGGVELAAGYAGQLAQAAPPGGVVSAINESATALDFGQVCVRGVAVAAGRTPNVKPQTADGDKIAGVVMRNAGNKVASTDGNNTVNVPRYAALDLVKQGTIFCIPVENVTEGDDALVITAASASSSKIGGTTGGAAGAGRIAFPGSAKWETTTTSGAIGKLRLNVA